ncbi:hypothetical protein MNBD_GAMMA15-1193 [hydrothermal vent metagenome]|uniref:Uncharacterized protein n=1 Tax=hydrothermal vent metagenome TaxID=652676 RepID=A0A3B0YD28_9ZZZZ
MSGNPEKMQLWNVRKRVALLLVLALATPVLAARQEQKKGVIIPDAERIYSDVSTRIRATSEGASWEIPLPNGQAWIILKRSLQRLGVSVTESDSDTPQLLTEWITWGYDPASQTAQSKRPHFGSMGTMELHKFRFTLIKGSTDESTEIRVSDITYLKKVDIAPDSEYSWMEWRDTSPQAGAAFTFGRRLQGTYQAAMSLQSVSVVPQPVITLLPPEPVLAAPPTQIIIPAIAPPVAKVPHAPTPVQAAVPKKARLTTLAPIPESKPAATTVARTDAGLLASFPLEKTWDALLHALQELNIDTETVDRTQRVIVTRWIDANYDAKNQQLQFGSTGDSGWAFNWSGAGPQHHRFKLTVTDAGEGKTLVRARHTASQERVDQTPDSSQTLLVWENRETNPDVATAFLRRLRIIANY